MEQNTSLLVTLLFTLLAALVGSALSARLGQSVILGYILAGIVIGPFTPGFVADIEAIQVMADIGIIFLMFAVGVQLSLRDLVRVGKVATGGAAVQVLATLGVGWGIGKLLGWPSLESLFFGAVLSNSSSTVLSKILSERGEGDTEPGRIAFAWSSVQDLSTVVLVVLLSGLVTGGDRLATDLLLGVGKAVLFLGIAIPVGVIGLPWLFVQVSLLRNREVFLLTIVVVALGTAFAASFLGLSLALGAFVAGIVVGESDLSHKILSELIPFRDIFAGLFFVSVGMLVDPAVVWEQPLLVLLTVALITLAKGTLSAILIFAFGHSIRVAMLGGVLLAQSAEFSFLLARLGLDLNAVSSPVFGLMLGGAAISIVIAPLLYRGAAPIARSLEATLPMRWRSIVRLEGQDAPTDLRRHIVLCGYGRVGSIVGAVLRRRDYRFIVIEEDLATVRRLQSEGIPAFLGNAANSLLLDRAGLTTARIVVLTVPDPVAARQIVDYARQVNPQIDIVVRTHSSTERAFLQSRGVNEAVLGELEMALEITRHTLQHLGISAREVQLVLQGLRGTS